MRRTIFASLFLLALTASAGDFAYLMSRDGNSITSGGTSLNINQVVRLNEQWQAPYLWAKRNGREYLIRDAATLSQAFAAFADSNALHAEYESLNARMRPLDDQQDALEDEMDRLSDRISDDDDGEITDAERGRMEKRIDELRERLRPIEKQLRVLEREEERLDQREEELTAIAERKLRDIVDRAIESGAAKTVK